MKLLLLPLTYWADPVKIVRQSQSEDLRIAQAFAVVGIISVAAAFIAIMIAQSGSKFPWEK